MGHYQDTISKGEMARDIYRKGYSSSEVAQAMKISIDSYFRVLRAVGGLTPLDKAEHMRQKAIRLLHEASNKKD